LSVIFASSNFLTKIRNYLTCGKKQDFTNFLEHGATILVYIC